MVSVRLRWLVACGCAISSLVAVLATTLPAIVFAEDALTEARYDQLRGSVVSTANDYSIHLRGVASFAQFIRRTYLGLPPESRTPYGFFQTYGEVTWAAMVDRVQLASLVLVTPRDPASVSGPCDSDTFLLSAKYLSVSASPTTEQHRCPTVYSQDQSHLWSCGNSTKWIAIQGESNPAAPLNFSRLLGDRPCEGWLGSVRQSYIVHNLGVGPGPLNRTFTGLQWSPRVSVVGRPPDTTLYLKLLFDIPTSHLPPSLEWAGFGAVSIRIGRDNIGGLLSETPHQWLINTANMTELKETFYVVTHSKYLLASSTEQRIAATDDAGAMSGLVYVDDPSVTPTIRRTSAELTAMFCEELADDQWHCDWANAPAQGRIHEYGIATEVVSSYSLSLLVVGVMLVSDVTEPARDLTHRMVVTAVFVIAGSFVLGVVVATCIVHPVRRFIARINGVKQSLELRDLVQTQTLITEVQEMQVGLASVVHKSLQVAHSVTCALAHYDIDLADGMLQNTFPGMLSELHSTLRTLTDNLRQYKAYLPHSVLSVAISETVCAASERTGSASPDSRSSTGGRRLTDPVDPRSVLREFRSLPTASPTSDDMERQATKVVHVRRTPVRRNVTVVCINCTAFLAAARSKSPGDLDEMLQSHVTPCLVSAARFRGVIDLLSGDHAFSSFNASRNCATHRVAAIESTFAASAQLEASGAAVTSAICADNAVCGDFGSDAMQRFMIIGTLPSRLLAVERVAARWRVRMLADARVRCDGADTWQFKYRGVLYSRKLCMQGHSFWEVRERRVKDEDVQGEWMYELKSVKDDPWDVFNVACQAWVRGDAGSARRLAQEQTISTHEEVRLAATELVDGIDSGAAPGHEIVETEARPVAWDGGVGCTSEDRENVA